MRNLILVTLLACAGLAIGSCAMATNGPGHDCYVESALIPPDVGFPLWEYIYTVDNYSTDHAIVSWTWSFGAYSGDVVPSAHDGVVTSGDWPVPACASPSDDDTTYRQEIFDDPAEPFDVTSTIRFDDDFEQQFDISIPITYVPEPSSTTAIASGLIGLIGLLRRRRA